MMYAVGDIHGELALLEKMLEAIREDAAQFVSDRPEIVFVGDYVDRGPDAKGVIDRLMKPIDGFVVTCLFGNHEQLFLDFLKQRDPEFAVHYFDANTGGRETLMSYGADMDTLERRIVDRQPYGDLLDVVPPAHIEWIAKLPYSYEIADCYFVHAGILPGVPFAEQVTEHQLWIRNSFLDDTRDHGKLVVHGHTPVDGGEILANRINVDAGACYWGTLQAVALGGEKPRFLKVTD